jgi:hypothetical protein
LQLHALQLLFVTAQNLARQTDGTRLVVSGGTIAQMQLHDLLLMRLFVDAAMFTSPSWLWSSCSGLPSSSAPRS